MAKTLIVLGLGIAFIGAIWLVFPKALSWFGNLPGDINIRRENTRVFMPIASMIVVSILLTVLANAVAWLSKVFSG